MTHLAKHFTLEELTYSRTAIDHGILNKPTPAARQSLQYLVDTLLEPLRVYFGHPIAITSGYRCPEVNRLVGGVPTSQHTRGQAADCYVGTAGGAKDLLQALEDSGLPFDQAILYSRRHFLHLSARPDGRRQVLYR